jgi:hypothetical protein
MEAHLEAGVVRTRRELLGLLVAAGMHLPDADELLARAEDRGMVEWIGMCEDGPVYRLRTPLYVMTPRRHA